MLFSFLLLVFSGVLTQFLHNFKNFDLRFLAIMASRCGQIFPESMAVLIQFQKNYDLIDFDIFVINFCCLLFSHRRLAFFCYRIVVA